MSQDYIADRSGGGWADTNYGVVLQGTFVFAIFEKPSKER
jgi:hypothetical protein